MNQKLFVELERRFKKDQKLAISNLKNKYAQNCHDNSEWLKKIIAQEDWLSEEKYGKKGELYAWLIVQHSDDIGFQKRCLNLLKKSSKTKERNRHLAYLTDRILIKGKKKQIYGTQFSNGKPFPIYDERNLERRRAKMNLMSFKKYYKWMQKN